MVKIEVLLNVAAPRVAEIRPQLNAELDALSAAGIAISTRKREVQSGALAMNEAFAIMLEVAKDIGAATTLVSSVVQLVNTVVRRYPNKTKKETKAEKDGTAPAPVVVVRVEGHEISVPATDEQIKRYVTKVKKGPKTPRAPRPKKPPSKKT